jgi:hypothetical protein
MPYDKPKVTIDLDEYQELLKLKEEVRGDEFVTMAKIVIATIFNEKQNPTQISSSLRQFGINFFVHGNGMGYGIITPENVHIEKIAKA